MPSRTQRAKRASHGSLSEELRFLASVDAELRAGAYEHALQRLNKHKGSVRLQEERAAMRVLALCGINNGRHAARARDNFLRSSPHSVLAARVRTACPASEPEP